MYRNREKKGNVRFYIDLTKRRFILKKLVMEKTKDMAAVKFVFADVNNNVCIMLKSGKVLYFNSEPELDTLIQTIG